MPGLQALSSLTGYKIKSTHIFTLTLLNFFSEICRTSNIGNSNRHIGCLNSEGKTIKPTISNLSQTTHLRRLRATLNLSWQAPEGILEPGSQLSEKVSKIQLSDMLDSEIKTSDESSTFNGDEAEILLEDDVKQTLGKIDSPEPDLQLAIDLVASRVGEEGNVIKDSSKDSAEDKFTRL